ncbi:SufE family protein [Shewanella sp.]|nr:SufE family protein [Shewanella sp.]
MSQQQTPNIGDFLAHGLTGDSSDVLQQLAQATNWQDRYRLVMLLGKHLPKLDQCYKVEHALVRGCESNAWLYHQQIDAQHYFIADSDTRIVKGLIALLLLACHGKNRDEINAFDAKDYFKQLGLHGQLSPSRTNGLFALAAAIKNAAHEGQ